jgi:hypothetical protein
MWIAKADEPTAPSTTQAYQDPVSLSTRRMHRLANCTFEYLQNHGGHLPAHLGDTVHAHGNEAALFFAPADEPTHTPPDPLTADWLTKNSSWTYLGTDFAYDTFTKEQRDQVILFHSKLDQPFHDADGKPFILACMADSVVKQLPVNEAQKQIDSSKAAYKSEAHPSKQSNDAGHPDN